MTQTLGRNAHERCICGDTYEQHSAHGSHFCMKYNCLCTRFRAAAMLMVLHRKAGQGSAAQYRSPTATDG